MKALTLTQPWATLVALGEKRIETRSWSTNYRGKLAIHAAKGFPKDARFLLGETPFYEILFETHHIQEKALPLGAIVATCDLVAIHKIPSMPRHFPRGVAEDHPLASYPVVLPPQHDQERAFGDYTPGRYAWLLTNVQKLAAPIPAKGALGLWDWDEQGLQA